MAQKAGGIVYSKITAKQAVSPYGIIAEWRNSLAREYCEACASRDCEHRNNLPRNNAKAILESNDYIWVVTDTNRLIIFTIER